MKDFFNDFALTKERIWLNCAHQGPLSNVSVKAAKDAIALKVNPYTIKDDMFHSVPLGLKTALAKLIHAASNDIILGNSASYGLHLLANGIPWKKGDEIILVRGDFPANILPWLGLTKYGVKIRFIELKENVIQIDELSKNITKRTRVICTSWVNSFTGFAMDIQSIGKLCQSKNILFVLNASQALGSFPIHVSKIGVGAIVSCGSKWLCGPYGTGFCWMKPEVLQSLIYNQSYWLNQQRSIDLNSMSERNITITNDVNTFKYDVFGTANFLNFMPWTASINYLLDTGIHEIKKHNLSLVLRLHERLEYKTYKLVSSNNLKSMSSIIVISHKQYSKNVAIYTKLKKLGFDIALREGNLRISPHLYNRTYEMDRITETLNNFV